tara:strand:- start:769 stop:1536 length:768 start_codon:yes stop_codon:yes gene_type:complete
MIIDAHLHLDETIDGTIKTAFKELNDQLISASVSKGILLHLEIQPWTTEEFSKEMEKYDLIESYVNINPHSKNALETLEHSIKNLNFIGLKLHPRLQEYSLADDSVLALVKYAGELDVPVLIDAFPDGTYLMQGFNPLDYAKLAQKAPDTRFIWAHMGGHYVLDFMMLAKRLSNVYMDLSYSLLYFQASSIPDNMIYAMKSMKFNKIFYGSDYPDRSVTETLQKSLEFFESKNLTSKEVNKILFLNAKEFYGWDL